jgi:hypothetical protein
VHQREHIVASVSVSVTPRPAAPTAVVADRALTAGLAVFALYHLALAVFMAATPHAFFKAVGPFDAYNSHYIRDTATFNAALAVGFAVAVRRASWRVPVLAVTTVQFALHSLNHLVDIDRAHPQWTGYFDFFSLLASTVLLAGLLARARSRPVAPSPPEGGPS